MIFCIIINDNKRNNLVTPISNRLETTHIAQFLSVHAIIGLSWFEREGDHWFVVKYMSWWWIIENLINHDILLLKYINCTNSFGSEIWSSYQPENLPLIYVGIRCIFYISLWWPVDEKKRSCFCLVCPCVCTFIFWFS